MKKKVSRVFNKKLLIMSALICGFLVPTAIVYGALLNLPNTPLFLNNETVCEASMSPITQSSQFLSDETRIFRATFNSSSWYGNLYAYGINLDGIVNSQPYWNAGCRLTGGACLDPALSPEENMGKAPDNRVIITRSWDGQNKGIPFRWPIPYQENGNTFENIAALLSNAPFPVNTLIPAEINANQNYGQALLDYLRGERSQEQQNSGFYAFRDRFSILGDIVHSNPLYIKFQSYDDSIETVPYSSFKEAQVSRTPMVAVGANDGMLHIFNVNNGEELLAFIPGNQKIYNKLPKLADENYSHEYFVDGGIVSNDVFMNGQWHTILVGGYRNGAQGIYALDITNPSTFTEENANQIYLWEFSDKDDPDVGYVYGAPIIAKVNSPSGEAKWAVIFGNGYNNSEPDGYASTTGKANLFILFIESGSSGTWTLGQNYIKLAVQGGDLASPNGLSAVYPVSMYNENNGQNYIVDYVYAGDLLGNLWRFDLRARAPSQWSAHKLFASNQPITSAPIVGPRLLSEEGVMVYFGTGKYLEEGDAMSNPPIQAFYGIWDKLDGTMAFKEKLLQQEIILDEIFEFDIDGDGVIDIDAMARITSNHPIDWQTQHQGWYLNLTQGERVIASPILRNGVVIFTTIIPSALPCGMNSRSWLMELHANNGGRLSISPFDLNQDHRLDSADYLTVPELGGEAIAPSGMQFESLLLGSPLIFTSEDKSFEIKVLNGMTGQSSIREAPGASGAIGRQSWKQL